MQQHQADDKTHRRAYEDSTSASRVEEIPQRDLQQGDQQRVHKEHETDLFRTEVQVLFEENSEADHEECEIQQDY